MPLEFGPLTYAAFALKAIVAAGRTWLGELARRCWYGDRGRNG